MIARLAFALAIALAAALFIHTAFEAAANAAAANSGAYLLRPTGARRANLGVEFMKLFSAIATLAIFAFIGVEIGAPIVDGFAAINSTLAGVR